MSANQGVIGQTSPVQTPAALTELLPRGNGWTN